MPKPELRSLWRLDAVWNDDFHHAARVAATGRTAVYFSDYRGTPEPVGHAKRPHRLAAVLDHQIDNACEQAANGN